MDEEGYSTRDDVDRVQELLAAAGAYINFTDALDNWGVLLTQDEAGFPWHHSCWKPSDDSERNLTKAGALIAAAIDALEMENEQ
jgi:hypothetical protein